jgi:hypothetical protein
VDFEILEEISDAGTIAAGRKIRQLRRLRRTYGGRLWRKRADIATVRLIDGSVRRAELHWYEAHGVRRVEVKIKRLLSPSS